MKIQVSGNDLPSAQIAEIEQLMAQMKSHPEQPHYLFDFKSARRLSACTDEQDYLDTFLELLHWRAGVGTSDFRIPGRQGFVGRIMTMVRTRAWRVLRYQHDRMAQQQNPINWNMFTALRLLRSQQLRQEKTYQARIKDLEERLGRLESTDED